MSAKLDAVAKQFETLSAELAEAIKHANIAANHFRSKEVPRGCAHGVATQGHLLVAMEILKEFAKLHRERALIGQ